MLQTWFFDLFSRQQTTETILLNQTYEVIVAEKNETPTPEKSTWINKVDQTSLGDLRKKFPTAFWVVGGIILAALVL